MELAVEYIYRHYREHDAVWWVPSDNAAAIRASLMSLATTLGVGSDVPSALKALTDGLPVRQWLLVFDNAPSPQVIAPYVPVAAAWQAAMDSLTTTEPGALALLGLLTHFKRNWVPRDDLRAVPGLDMPPELAAVLRDPVELHRAIRVLNRPLADQGRCLAVSTAPLNPASFSVRLATVCAKAPPPPVGRAEGALVRSGTAQAQEMPFSVGERNGGVPAL